MNSVLLAACERFSEGDALSALPLIAPGVRWVIVGENRVIEGLAALQVTAAQLAAQGDSRLRNQRIVVGGDCVVIEGIQAVENGVAYCDLYSITDGRICEIRSYCLCPAKR